MKGVNMFLNFFRRQKPLWRTNQVEAFIEEFSIWAKHTGNDHWIGFAKIRLKLIERQSESEGKNIRPDRFVEELLKLQSVIRKLNTISS